MTDTIVWITGASGGIGGALAATVPYPDAHLFDISRSGPADGSTIEHVPADLADPTSWGAVEEHLLAQLGTFEGSRAVFLHNAGTIDPVGFAGEVDSAAYRHNVVLNASAPQALGHAFLRAVRASGFTGQAHLVMMTSGAASSSYAGWTSYCAGKAAVDAWVRAAGLEQEQRGRPVQVLAVAPGTVATRMQEQLRNTDEHDFPRVAKFRELHAEGKLTDPADAARGIWGLLERGLDNGAVVDLRKLA